MDRLCRQALGGILLGGALLVPAGLHAQTPSRGYGLALGAPAPSVSVQDLNGNAVELLDLVRGQPALIEFWATWCEFCQKLQPQLDRIQKEHGNRIKVVAVAVGVNQTLRRIQRHLEAHDPGYPYVYDSRGSAVRAYQAVATSIVTILDSQGKVAYVGVGPAQKLEEAVAEVLKTGQ